MALNGNLEDLPFADVIQLLHVAKKSGVLRLQSDEGAAALICRDGFIVGAVHPHQEVSLGAILLESGDVGEEVFEENPRTLLGDWENTEELLANLIDEERITKEQGWEALRKLIHRTMAELISWEEGTFIFEVGKVEMDEEFQHFPTEMETWGGVDTQGALVEALRIFDERNREQHERDQANEEKLKIIERLQSEALAEEKEEREQEEEEKEGETEDTKETKKREEGVLAAVKVSEDAQFRRALRPQRAILLCTDGYLKHTIKRVCQEEKIFAYSSGIEKDIETAIEDATQAGATMVFVADLANPGSVDLGPKRRLAVVRRIKRSRPELPLVILSHTASSKMYKQAFELSARVMIPKPSEKKNKKADYVHKMKNFMSALSSCLKSIFDEEYELLEKTYKIRTQMDSLKRRVQSIQDRKSSPDITLIVLQHVAEYMDRGIIFLIRKTDLLGLGSFGMNNKGDTISTVAMRLKIPLNQPSVFADVVSSGIPFQGETNDPLLDRVLFSVIGRPVSDEILILPLKTENKTRALIYADFGEREANPIETDALEILASQAGMAMEVALTHARPTPGGTRKKAG